MIDAQPDPEAGDAACWLGLVCVDCGLEAVALEAGGVDAIVATGSEAGGHRVSFLTPAETSLVGTFALVPQVVDAVRVPVIAAGCIAEDTVLTRVTSGRPARGRENRMVRVIEANGRIAPFPVQNWLTGRLRAAAAVRDAGERRE